MNLPTQTFLRLLVILLLWADRRCSALKWLALYKNKQRHWNSTQHCVKSRQYGLVSNQIKICKQHLDLMPTVRLSTKMAVETCQTQFSDRRWNCSSAGLAPKLSRDLTTGTREQAYVYAVSSASLVHAVARACSIGVTTKCSCGALPNSPPDGDFKWGGCGDDVQFGLLFSDIFTEAPMTKKGKRKTGKKAAINRHNNNAGRRVVANSLTTACKCHGVSGSCSIKTCWRALPDFDKIGATLKKQYAVAVEVAYRRVNKVKQFIPLNPQIRNIRGDELLYYTKSPDYCNPDKKTGSVGTTGRFCDIESKGSGGCLSMCCGRGYTSFTMEIIERCECKYYWCCYVKCKECPKTLHLNQCR
ncbi:protein Wnt-11b-2-like [Liolophura sinensis]|uniref:protein Wnt-11b-2-like n=1 Tax=Liolophura sinensis TaxID=3198878 RepID=UPI0031591D7E